MRQWLRRWLGVDDVQNRLERHRQEREEERIREEKATAREAADRFAEMSRLKTGVELAVDNEKATREAVREAVVQRLDDLSQRLSSFEFSRAEAELPVKDPVSCPNGHTTMVRLQLLERISATKPETAEVVGGGYFCPDCGTSFYSATINGVMRLWRPKSAQPEHVEATEPPPGPPPPPPRAPIKFGPRGRRP